MGSKKSNESTCTERMGENSKVEQVLVTNKHPFYRKKGQRCPNCGSTEEYLFVVSGTILLWCDGCESAKGKDVFREWNIEKQEDTL